MSQLLKKADDRTGVNQVFNLRLSQMSEAIEDNELSPPKSEATFSYDFLQEVKEIRANPYGNHK